MRRGKAPETHDKPGKTDASAHDLEQTVGIIEDAAAAIDEMLRYNRAMKSVAAQGVAHYRADAEEARREASRLAEKVSRLEAERKGVVDEYEARIRALEARLAKQDQELESMRSLLWPEAGRPKR